MNLQKLSRREREKQSRRAEILQAAWEVFSSKDYDSATVDDVAEAAELSKGTLYLYFQSKAELFISTFEMGLEKIVSLIREVLSSNDDPVAGFREMIKQMLDFCEENADFFKIMSSQRAHFEIHSEQKNGCYFKDHIGGHIDIFSTGIDMIASYIQQGIEIGVFREVDPKDAAFILLDIMRGFAIRRIVDPMAGSLPEKTGSVVTILLDGLRKRD